MRFENATGWNPQQHYLYKGLLAVAEAAYAAGDIQRGNRLSDEAATLIEAYSASFDDQACLTSSSCDAPPDAFWTAEQEGQSGVRKEVPGSLWEDYLRMLDRAGQWQKAQAVARHIDEREMSRMDGRYGEYERYPQSIADARPEEDAGHLRRLLLSANAALKAGDPDRATIFFAAVIDQTLILDWETLNPYYRAHALIPASEAAARLYTIDGDRARFQQTMGSLYPLAILPDAESHPAKTKQSEYARELDLGSNPPGKYVQYVMFSRCYRILTDEQACMLPDPVMLDTLNACMEDPDAREDCAAFLFWPFTERANIYFGFLGWDPLRDTPIRTFLDDENFDHMVKALSRTKYEQRMKRLAAATSPSIDPGQQYLQTCLALRNSPLVQIGESPVAAIKFGRDIEMVAISQIVQAFGWRALADGKTDVARAYAESAYAAMNEYNETGLKSRYLLEITLLLAATIE
nr:hypothetical protein GCM10011355_32040 [Aquisalinus luteolus]